MNCSKCGAADQEDKYCDHCGTKLEELRVVERAEASSVTAPGLAAVPAVIEPVSAAKSQETVANDQGSLPVPKARARSGAPRFMLSHWIQGFESPIVSPLEFFRLVIESIEHRQLPQTKLSHVQWQEAGLLTAKRVYLRVTRKDCAIDLCAAPFGTGFFVSWWCGEVRDRRLLNLILLIILLFAFVFVVLFLFLSIGGIIGGIVGGLAGGLAGWLAGLILSLLFLLTAVTLAIVVPFAGFPEQTDDFLLQTAFIGSFYERYFRRITYYRIDTAAMFQSTVHAAVLEVLDGLSDTKGIRRLSELERKPIHRDIFGRMR